MGRLCILMLALILLSSCMFKVGSAAWCDAMKDKPKGDWSGTEAVDFAKHCIFK